MRGIVVRCGGRWELPGIGAREEVLLKASSGALDGFVCGS
jgi:hypothetical protein